MRALGTDQIAYVSLAAVALPAAAVSSHIGKLDFSRFFGPLEPITLVGAVAVIGFLCVRHLETNEKRSTSASHDNDGKLLLYVTLFGLLFALPAIIVDLAVGFPENINVRLPWAVAYYVAMALVAETMFHLVPLALMGLRGVLSVGSIALIALIEPTFQLIGTQTVGHFLLGFVGLHVYLFNVVQLLVFRVYGIRHMIAMRLAYYVGWHIAWGEARFHF